MIEKFDTVVGTTSGVSGNGTFVKLENGITGWMSAIFLPVGTDVMCSVTRVKADENFVFLNLDSVMYPQAA